MTNKGNETPLALATSFIRVKVMDLFMDVGDSISAAKELAQE